MKQTTKKISNMNWYGILVYTVFVAISSLLIGYGFGFDLLTSVLCGVGGMVSLVVLVMIDILLDKIFNK